MRYRALAGACALYSLSCAEHRPLPHSDAPVVETSKESHPDAATVGDIFGWVQTPGGDAGEVIAEPDDEARALFEATDVRTFEVQVRDEDLQRIDAQPSEELTVPASMRFDGRDYGDIGIRYKGSAGAFLVPCTAATQPGRGRGAKVGKCSIKLDFGFQDDKARFFGLKKLNLHSMGRDPSFMREQLGYGLFREQGIAAPRTNYARLVINGKLEGLFLMVEHIDARFTRSRFSEGGDGNLYKEIWPLYPVRAPYRKALETNEGPATNVDKIVSLAWTLQLSPSSALDWLDRKYSLRLLAVDRLTVNDDGALHWYCYVPQGNNMGPFNNHNYYWYEAEQAGRLWLIPWDLDGSMGGVSRVRIDSDWMQREDCGCHVLEGASQRRAGCDPLTSQLTQLRDDYRREMKALVTGPFMAEQIEQKLSRWSKRIEPFVKESAGLGGAPDVEAWKSARDTVRDTLETVRAEHAFDLGDAD
jgi:spore coat protein H